MVPVNAKATDKAVQVVGATLALALATSRLQVKLNVACEEINTSGVKVFRAPQSFVPLPLVLLSAQVALTVIAVTPGAKVTV